MAEQRATFVQRSLEKVYFEHKEMDYYLSWILGRQLYEGCDPSECMQVAERIVDGDPQSWQEEWRKQAELTEAQAQAGSRTIRASHRKPRRVLPPLGGRGMRAARRADTLLASPLKRV